MWANTRFDMLWEASALFLGIDYVKVVRFYSLDYNKPPWIDLSQNYYLLVLCPPHSGVIFLTFLAEITLISVIQIIAMVDNENF